MADDLKPNEYMGQAISIAFGKWWPGTPLRPACIEVWYQDPETGARTTVMWRQGEEGDLFEKLRITKEIFDKRNAAAKRIEARRIDSFESRTRKPKPTGTGPDISLEDLL